MTRLADVLVPPNDEGTRATVLRWCKQVGDAVVKDEPLVELETDKVTVEIAAPDSGTLVEILKDTNVEVSPDEVLARLRLSDGAAADRAAAGGAAAAQHVARPAPLNGAPERAATGDAAKGRLSPAVRRLLKEHSVTAGEVQGSGRDGRITAADVARHLAEAPAPATPARVPEASRVPRTAIRRRVAEHMARSLAEAPHVTTLFEADLTRVLAHRKRHAEDYRSRGARLTLTTYFVSACARALKLHREVNATFHADALELHADVNIGVGTALGTEGLIVPVIHRASELSLFDLSQRLDRLVEAARNGKLTPEQVRGGTFTLSNHGVSGSLLAAPIVINQPQVAILGVGKVERRVCVIEAEGVESIGVRSMCYLTLTIDHRALDAFQANAFLSEVVGTLERWPAEDP
jgi:2-oxoglutarate dehydrogenase E2 component (dihydrolipoamide succinyltransferase)